MPLASKNVNRKLAITPPTYVFVCVCVCLRRGMRKVKSKVGVDN